MFQKGRFKQIIFGVSKTVTLRERFSVVELPAVTRLQRDTLTHVRQQLYEG